MNNYYSNQKPPTTKELISIAYLLILCCQTITFEIIDFKSAFCFCLLYLSFKITYRY